MQDTKIAIRYAKSFLGLTEEKGVLDAAYRDMSMIAEAVSGSRELRVMLNNPILSVDQKLKVLGKVFSGLSDATRLFVELITKKGREADLGAIAESFITQYKLLKHITTAEVTSAAVLTEEAKQRITALVSKQVGGAVELKLSVNPDLIGGFVLRIGDKQVDTSVLSKVNALRKDFSKNEFLKGF